jgi:threonine 3-dehydrogenase
VIGHEFVGIVDQVGNGVTDFKEGELVTTEGHIVCGHCRNCLAGAPSLPEHERHRRESPRRLRAVRRRAVIEYLALRSSIPLDVISCSDPLGNAVHTALSFDLVGEMC